MPLMKLQNVDTALCLPSLERDSLYNIHFSVQYFLADNQAVGRFSSLTRPLSFSIWSMSKDKALHIYLHSSPSFCICVSSSRVPSFGRMLSSIIIMVQV